MIVEFGNPEEIDDWMKHVRSVREEFPGMETETRLEEHREIVLKFMRNQGAVCCKEQDCIVDVLLYSVKHNMICFLSVSPQYRRRGIASDLLAFALAHFDRSKQIIVSTFRKEDEKGIAPRALYRKFGFKEGALKVEFDYPNQIFVLDP